MFHTIEEALADLKDGKVIILVDDETRENEGDFVALADKARPEVINFMIKEGRGLVCTTITEDLAKRLDLPLMARENTDPFGTAFTVSIDHESTTTGISAYERSATIQAMIDPDTRADAFKRPGHVFPLIAKEAGVLTRDGHTEASVDLAKLCGATPSSVICEIIKEDGTMARVPDLAKIAEEHDLKMITIADLITYRKQHENHVQREVRTTLPTAYGNFQVYGYSNALDDKEHVALVMGDVRTDKPVLTRVHSECLTGDIFSSHRCDCGPQLHAALAQIAKEGRGILIYMRQEGRGIGLINKLRAYHLQDTGLDTVEANEQLGFQADLREYHLSAQILRDLDVTSINLLTNNPRKLANLQANHIDVHERIPLSIQACEENKDYLQTKQKKLGHLLSL